MLVSLRVFKHTEAQWWTPDVWGAGAEKKMKAASAVCGGAPARRKLFYIFSELDGHNHVFLSAIGAAERALSLGYGIIRGSQFVAMCNLTATKFYTQVL